ncbi:hypothetical protein IWX77_002144 [Cryobacterium sp. CAN_C2]
MPGIAIGRKCYPQGHLNLRRAVSFGPFFAKNEPLTHGSAAANHWNAEMPVMARPTTSVLTS